MENTKFKSSLGYIVNSKLAWATEYEPAVYKTKPNQTSQATKQPNKNKKKTKTKPSLQLQHQGKLK